jgi:hypothetical protein
MYTSRYICTVYTYNACICIHLKACTCCILGFITLQSKVRHPRRHRICGSCCGGFVSRYTHAFVCTSTYICNLHATSDRAPGSNGHVYVTHVFSRFIVLTTRCLHSQYVRCVFLFTQTDTRNKHNTCVASSCSHKHHNRCVACFCSHNQILDVHEDLVLGPWAHWFNTGVMLWRRTDWAADLLDE